MGFTGLSAAQLDNQGQEQTSKKPLIAAASTRMSEQIEPGMQPEPR